MQLPTIEKYTTPTTTLNKRQQLLKMFHERLNQERGEYKPITGSQLGAITAYIKTEDLLDFYNECNRAKHFSKFFFYTTKKR